MSEKETGGTAFPTYFELQEEKGMTLRQYAAIKLRVPDSGTDWLDEMIAKSLHDEFAAQAMTGIMAADDHTGDQRHIALVSYAIADAMLEARK